ncbi:hypothetical protein [Bacillus vallismortis]|uniref:hypothetical protein n=1 Tax=Bacillus vallismortis TaxID=72361 RepID=UPI002090F621|nr:hypothetical protein [Bacillus vallismortis]MCO4852415.1 hypothetical protein [Bacillus vallismortis]
MRSVIIEEKGRTGPAAGSKKKTSLIKTHSDEGRFQLNDRFFKKIYQYEKRETIGE